VYKLNCKETNAIALAEAMSQGTLDDFVEKKPAFRMSSGDKKKIDDDLALYQTSGKIIKKNSHFFTALHANT
jgi:hypothetical protein